ncbi:MAG: hypothetical protein U0871_04725 [Gemmataceae bacterium]
MNHAATQNDLIVLSLLIPKLAAGLSWTACRADMRVSESQFVTALNNLWPGGYARRTELASQARQGRDARRNPAWQLHRAVTAALRALQPTLEALADTCRVRVAGGEASLMLLLPRVLREHPGLTADITLDLYRVGGPAERAAAVRSGAVDLAVGPAPAAGELDGVVLEELFAAECGLVFRTDDFPDRPAALPDGFRDRTVFVIRPETAPDFRMREIVSAAMRKRFGDDYAPRFSYVDSSLYTPPLVRATGQLGVYYTRPEWLVDPLGGGLDTVPLAATEAAATFHLFTPSPAREVSAAAGRLTDAIRQFCRDRRTTRPGRP